MAVRWARGLFRFWVVGSGIWIALMAAAWWNPIVSPSAYVAERQFGILKATGQPMALSSEELAAATEAKARGLMKEVKINSVPDHPWLRDISVFVRSETADDKISEAVDKVSSHLIARYDEELDESRVRNTMSAISWTLIPPLLLLAIGAAVSWAIKGFANSERKQDAP